jgi:2-methylcitrate dehydratase
LAEFVNLARDTNQALGLGQFAIDFLNGEFPAPSEEVLSRLELFHLDSVACAVSAIAQDTNAPSVLRREALQYRDDSGAACFGSTAKVAPEKAVAANCAAVREWDANGTNFGFDPQRRATAGEFGHNDFYPVALAAAQVAGLDGRQTALGMLLIDEIRGRLAEVFSLKDYKIDHVVHGTIASAVVYAVMVGGTAKQIESAIGMLVAHYIPFRAIRAGQQLSDSKGASAALNAEAAVLCARRSMDGFVGPGDIFRNRQAIFCLFQPPDQDDASPFDLRLTTSGNDFAVMGMHFKLGLYEHQSAGAVQALIDLLSAHPAILDDANKIKTIRVTIYEPAYSIICDPAKRNPRTRQSADHSMVYILATLLRRAFEARRVGWKQLMLMPADYDAASLADEQTRRWIEKIEPVHGGPDYDSKYPDGIPTNLAIQHEKLGLLDSGLVMYPAGHARNTNADLDDLLKHKFEKLATLGVADADALRERFGNLPDKSPDEIAKLYDFEIKMK